MYQLAFPIPLMIVSSLSIMQTPVAKTQKAMNVMPEVTPTRGCFDSAHSATEMRRHSAAMIDRMIFMG